MSEGSRSEGGSGGGVTAARGADPETVALRASDDGSGEPFFEEVPVEPVSEGSYRLQASPGLLDGVAAGDVFIRHEDGRYDVVERGGNLCVQIWYPGVDLHRRVDADLLPAARRLGGWLDGRADGVTVLTFPLEAGFDRITTLLDGWVATVSGAGWSYANVYAEDGETPLGWWEDPSFAEAPRGDA